MTIEVLPVAGWPFYGTVIGLATQGREKFEGTEIKKQSYVNFLQLLT